MFKEIVEKIEEAFASGVNDVKEDIVAIKDRLVAIEKAVFAQALVEAAPAPAAEIVAPAEDTPQANPVPDILITPAA